LLGYGIGLSDETRMYILSLLKAHGDLTATELVAALEVSQPAVAKQMRVLIKSGLVEQRRDGKWVIYSIDPEAAGLILSEGPGMAPETRPSSGPVSLSDDLRSRLEALALERVGKGLADPTRVRILSLLRIYGTLRASKLRVALGIHRTTLIEHMHALVGLDWASSKSRGRGVTYSLTEQARDLFSDLRVDVIPPQSDNPPAPEAPCVDPTPLSEQLVSKLKEDTRRSVDGYIQRLRETVRVIREHEGRLVSQWLTHVISDRTRVLMLALLNMYGELTSTELAASLNVSHATVSEHMRIRPGSSRGCGGGSGPTTA